MALRYSETFDGYHRGMLQRRSPRQRDGGYCDEALNVAFVGGVMVSRPGLRPFNGVAFNGVVRGHGWHVAATGARELLVAAGANLQRCSLGGDPIDMPLDALPSTQRTRVEVEKVHFLSLSGGTNTTFIYDGVNPNLKWDGTQLTAMGLPNGPTPASPTLGAVNAACPSKGEHSLVITLVSPVHEGDISVVARTYTADGVHRYTVASPTNVAAGDPALNQFDDPQVTKWRLWTTVAGGAELRFEGEADIGVDITLQKNDAQITGSDLVEQLVNGAPQAPIVAMVEHRGQLVAVMADDRSLLRFSNYDPEYMVPEGWPRNYVQPVAHGDGDVITALRSFYEWCMIFKETSTHAIVGESFADYKIQPLLAGGTRQGIGTAFPGSVLQVENSVFFGSRDGFYRVNRFETQRALIYGGVVANRVSQAIDDLYAAANFSLGSATFFDRKRHIFVFLGHG